MIIFNREVYVELYNNWKITDEDGDLYLRFDLFNISYYLEGLHITFCNFGITIYWY